MMVNLAENVSFVEHYRPALLWLAAPIVALLTFLVLLVNLVPEGLIKLLLSYLCFFLFTTGILLRYSKTWSLNLRPLQTAQIQAQDFLSYVVGMVLMLIALIVIQLMFAAISWPVTEIVHQGRFLSDAWKSWQTGQVLLGPDGQVLRAGSHLQYHSGNKPLS